MRAEMLTSALIIRQISLMCIAFTVAHFSNETYFPLYAVSLINLFCYLLSRTKYFRVAATIAILDPIAFVLGLIAFDMERLATHPQITLSLLIGPLLASLVLSFRSTLIAVAATMAVYITILLHLPPSLHRLFAELGIMAISVCLVAVVASRLRDRGEEALEIERAKVVQASKLSALGQMAGGVAHELNSPLGAIILNIELMNEALESEGLDVLFFRDRLSKILKTSIHMGKIISTMKDIARDSSHDPLAPLPIEIWINETLLLCEQRFQSKGVALKINRDNFDTLCAVRRVHMQQVLLNLMNNAFDAVQASADKWVTLEAKRDGTLLRITLTDSGPRVTGEHAKRLFEPFFSTKDFGHGTGLGLSVSQSLMKNQNGNLLHLPNEKHTTFVIEVPIYTNATNVAHESSAA